MQYYKDTTDQEVYGYDPATQQDLINQAIAAGWTNITGSWPLPPSDEELRQQCKKIASELLYETDWTSIADIANPENVPYLTNQAEFLAYRSILRNYAINPVTDPVWPVQPIAQWSPT